MKRDDLIAWLYEHGTGDSEVILVGITGELAMGLPDSSTGVDFNKNFLTLNLDDGTMIVHNDEGE